jgi:tetratricopeptide (TPR) repeat protein
MRDYAGERDAARAAWERSLVRSRTTWATRNLALLAREEGQLARAADLYAAALRMRPSLLPLAVECGRALIEAGRPGEWLDLLAEVPEPVRSAGRVRLLEGQAALAVGDLARAGQLFVRPLVIDDLREGERSLSHLWFEYHEQRLSAEEGVPVDDALRARVRREFPVPAEIDFRMSSDPPPAG